MPMDHTSVEKSRVSGFEHTGFFVIHWTSLGCSDVDPHLERTTCSGRCQTTRKILRSRYVPNSGQVPATLGLRADQGDASEVGTQATVCAHDLDADEDVVALGEREGRRKDGRCRWRQECVAVD